jgi:hypothetical protein
VSAFKDLIIDIVEDYEKKVPIWPHDVRIELISEKFKLSKEEVEEVINQYLEEA